VVKLSRAQHPHQSIQVAQTGSSHIQLVYQLNKAGASAEVRDLQGRMLQSSRLPLSSGTVLIPVSSVNRSSILLVVVRTPNGDIFSEKILLQ
jgi:hypothetical protein